MPASSPWVHEGDEVPPLLPPSQGAVGCSQCRYLVLVDLGQHGVEDKAGRGRDVQALLGQHEPVDEVLQGVLEVCGQGQCFFQLRLPQQGGRKGRGEKKHNTEGESSRSAVSQTEAAFVSLTKCPSNRNLVASARERDLFTKGKGFQ